MFENNMLIPKHCAEVSVINVGKGFSPDKTMEKLLGKPTFYLTKYVILREGGGQLKSGERASIIKLRTDGDHLMKTIVGGEVLAHPEKCLTITDPTIDEFIPNQVILKAVSARLNNDVEGVVLSGRNENITFVYLREQKIKLPLKILLVDTIPPKPSRLRVLYDVSKSSNLLSEHINIEVLNVDASKMLKETYNEGRIAFTPCPTEELSNTYQPITSLATITNKAENNKPLLNIDLIGCSLSRAALNRLTKKMGLNIEVSLRDICPLHTTRKVAPTTEVQGIILRCCKATESAIAIQIKNKPIIILPWAPSIGEFVNAIDSLVNLVIGLDVV